MIQRNNLKYFTKLLFLYIVGIFTAFPLIAEQVQIQGDILLGQKDGTRVVQGNMKIVRENMVITASEGTYNEEKGIATAKNKVKVVDPETVLTCDHLVNYTKLNKIVARNHPKIIKTILDKKKNQKTVLELIGDIIEIYSEENRVNAIGSVMLEQTRIDLSKVDENGKHPETKAKVYCKAMEIFLKGNRSIAKGNVIIQSGSIFSTGEKAIFNDNDEVVEIYGNSIAWQESSAQDRRYLDAGNKDKPVRISSDEQNEAEGDKAIFFGREELLKLLGNARAWKKGDKNVMRGERITYFLKDGRFIVEQAKATVHPGNDSKPLQKKMYDSTGEVEPKGEDEEFKNLENLE